MFSESKSSLIAIYQFTIVSCVAHVRKNSEARLVQELRYASHLGLPAVMARLEGANHANLARIISNHIHKVTGRHEVT